MRAEGSRSVGARTSLLYSLLVAFASDSSSATLSRAVGRERSVVSRQIKRISEVAPVLTKVGGKYKLTPMGFQVVAWARAAMATQRQLVAQGTSLALTPGRL